MTTILVLESTELERRLICSLLSRSVFAHLEEAASMDEAWEIIHNSPPDILVTELLLPSTEGIVFIRKVHQSSPSTQIILMTADGGELVAAQALLSGASGFVPKSLQAELLVPTVNRLLDRIHVDRVNERLQGALIESHNTYALPPDRALIKPLTNHLQELLRAIGFVDTSERMRIGVALEEAINNALIHGNLEISVEDLARARCDIATDRVTQLINERCRQAPYCHRTVRVECHFTHELVEFVVEDEGAGFDVEEMESTPFCESMVSGKGRGLLLMRNFMDEVEYNATGNRVVMRKFLGLPSYV